MSKTEIDASVVSVDPQRGFDWVTLLTIRSNNLTFSAEPGAYEQGDSVLITIETQARG